MLPDVFTASHRKQIIELATRYRLPTIGGIRHFADGGVLLAYGLADPFELYQRPTSYVDQILKGATNKGDPPALPGRQQTFDISCSRAAGTHRRTFERESPSAQTELHRRRS